jgi:hypothetical protein
MSGTPEGNGSVPYEQELSESVYMPMTIGEFCGTDLSYASQTARADYYRMKVRMVRDRRETPEAREYFDGIQGAFEESFQSVTPELLTDPSSMNLVRCVDPYTDQQLEELNFAPNTEIKLPGGLTWFDLTGTMQEWIVPRIFNETLVAGLHRNCGGLAIVGALTGERQVAGRNRATESAYRIAAETAALVRQEYFKRKGHELDPDASKAFASFGGPKLIFPVGSDGTAEAFVTPKAVDQLTVERQFSPRELVDNVENWIDGHLSSQVSD